MRGDAERQADIMLAVTPDSFVPADHPIRRIKPIVDAALQRLSPLFDTMYSRRGRPSIPPEHLLKASVLIALYSVRSDRPFCERLLEVDAARAFFGEVVVASAAPPTALGRALHRRRDAARGLSVAEELTVRATAKTRCPGEGATRKWTSGAAPAQ